MVRFTSTLFACALLVSVVSCSDSGDRPAVQNNGMNNANAGNSGNANTMDEVCNGEDDDGDGEVDEGFDVGETCTVGDGACADVSTLVCDSTGMGTVCDAAASQPAQELCGDNVDNDCDGDVDEGFGEIGTPCMAGEGACQVSGATVCGPDGMQTVCDATPIEPPEANEVTCDGIDNDCDGEVDEGCDDDGDTWCDVGFVAEAGGPCTSGEGDCDDENADIYPGSMIPGCGDGADNDCNGEIDDFKVVSRVTGPFNYNDNPPVTTNDNPSLLATAMSGGDGFCATFVEPGAIGIQTLVFELSGGTETLRIQNGYYTGSDFRIYDITDYFSTSCATLFGHTNGGEFRLGVASVGYGSTTADIFPLTQPVADASLVWPYSMFSDQPFLRIAAVPEANQGEANLFTAGPSVDTVDNYRVGLLSEHTFFDRYGTSDFIFSGSFFNRFFGLTTSSYMAVSEWGNMFDLKYPDTFVIDGRRFVSGYDGSSLGIYELIDSNGFSIGAQTTVQSASDRDHMTRVTFFEGPDGKTFVIDSAADALYELRLDVDTITLVPADISQLPPGSDLLAGGTQEGNVRILSLAGTDPLVFETSDLQCF